MVDPQGRQRIVVFNSLLGLAGSVVHLAGFQISHKICLASHLEPLASQPSTHRGVALTDRTDALSSSLTDPRSQIALSYADQTDIIMDGTVDLSSTLTIFDGIEIVVGL
jgi:hypothetical protein